MAAVLEALTVPRASGFPAASLSPIVSSSVRHLSGRRNFVNLSKSRGLKIQSIHSSESVLRSKLGRRGARIVCQAQEAVQASSSSSAQSTSFDLLRRLLAANDFREADNETRRLIIALAGEAAQKRGYVFFSEVQFIPESDLKTLDELWRDHSNNKFGYSVQKRLWEKSEKDFTRFFIKLGWMKKLDTEILQYNYRAFPDEFMWELNDAPEGHLPLTNALRGTQLLACILTHPAFAADESTAIEEEAAAAAREDEQRQPVGKGLFKTNYSF